MLAATARRFIPTNLVEMFRRLTRREQLLMAPPARAPRTFIPVKARYWGDQKEQNYAAAREAEQSAAAAADTNYPALEARAHNELDKAVSWALPVKSVPIARVVLEEECLAAALKAGVPNAEVHSSETVDPAGPISFVKLEISGLFTWPALQALAAGLVEADHLFIIDGIEVPDGAKPRFRLDLRAPIRVEARVK